MEINYNINPKWAGDSQLDLDLDGLSNIEEYYIYTDPRDPDSDDDGYSDGTEVTAGTDPLDQNSYPDPGADNILLEISILIAGISLAVALVVRAILIRSQEKPMPPKAPKKPVKGK